MKKILIINPFGIGDVLFSTPLVDILKENFPGTSISYVCNKRVVELIATNPYLDKVFVYEKDDYRDIWRISKAECVKKIIAFLKSIKKEKFDIAIDLSLGYQYSLLLKFMGVGKRLGFNYKNRGRFLTDKISIEGFCSKHVVEYYLDLLKLLKVDIKKYKIEPRLFLSEEEKGWADNFLRANGVTSGSLLIGIIPGCGASWGLDAKFRRWDKENFAEVADRIADKYKAKIMFFGDSKEAAICRAIEKMMKNPAIVSSGKTNLRQSLGLLARCALVITNDGGPLHMATAIKVNTISIFGPVDEKVYGPYPADSKHVVVSNNDIPCRPCYKKFKYRACEDRICLKTITPNQVLQAVDEMMR